MQTQYLLKLLQNGLRPRPVDPGQDIFGFKGILLGGTLFDETNIVTVSGGNSLLSSLSAVSGASSLRDDSQDLALQSVSGVLFNFSSQINATLSAVSGASSARDDLQDLVISAVSGSLQSQITAIATNKAKEERFLATAGQTLVTLSTIVFDPSPSVRDIVVYKNTSRLFQSANGQLSAGDYIKLGTNQIQLLYGLVDGDRIIVRQERTGGGIGGTGGGTPTDLTNIIVDPSPAISGTHGLGTAVQAWSGVYLKDTVINAVWHLQMVSGSLQIVQV